MTMEFKVSDELSECFIATAFTFGLCPCGCGYFKLVGFDENGVARALVAIEPDQFARMAEVAVRACVGDALGVKEMAH